MKAITVQTVVKADIKKVWEYLTVPTHIKEWCFASDDWGVGEVLNDIRVGGKFKTDMMAKDGSSGFDFTGTYTRVDPLVGYDYTMDGDDARKVSVTLKKEVDGVLVSETFDMENENSEELQRNGWQAILENLKKYVESQ